MELSNCIEKLGNVKTETNVSLSTLSTFKIGGPADLVVRPSNRDELIRAVSAARECGLQYVVIGNGSNILFDDEGFRGVVIVTSSMKSISVKENKITADCGVYLTSLASCAQAEGLCGLEFAYGIPGCVGGAVFMNAGAYGGQISDILAYSEYYDPATCKTERISLAEHKYGYRESVYLDFPDRVVLGAVFELEYGDKNEIKARCDANLLARRTKQPLEFPSAGSVFKRPAGYFAGKLIDDSGLRGVSVGGAQVSEKHAGFIINRGTATSADVLNLIELIKNTVYKKFGVMLECEIRHIRCV